MRKCVNYGTARQDTDDNMTRRMRITCRMSKAKNTHSESVIINAFPQHWLQIRSFILCYTYTACLVYHTEVTACQIFIYF